jgi:hypothetical protein
MFERMIIQPVISATTKTNDISTLSNLGQLRLAIPMKNPNMMNELVLFAILLLSESI